MRREARITDRTADKSVKNKNYEENIKRTFQYTRWFFACLGVWPMITRDSSRRAKLLSPLAVLACLAMITFTFVPSALHAIFREKNCVVKVMLLGPVGASFGAIMKYAIIVSRASTISMCVERMKEDWMRVESDDERAIMTRNMTAGREITVICGLFLYTGGMSYHMMIPLFKGTTINEFNETIRPLSYPGYDIFFAPPASPLYEILFFLICVSAFVRYTVTIGISSLAAIFVTHACGQIQIVLSRLGKLFDETDGRLSNARLKERMSIVIQGHVNALRLSARIDEGLREICLVEIMSSTVSLCVLEYSCMKELLNRAPVSFVTYLLLLASYVFIVLILCYIGELLQEQCQRVGHVAYMIEWYRLPDKLGLGVVMIIAMAHYPRKLTAGRMMDLSIINFGVIIRTSITYLNMLRASTP